MLNTCFSGKQSIALCKLLISTRAKAGRARDTTLLPKHQLAEGSCNYKGSAAVLLKSTNSSSATHSAGKEFFLLSIYEENGHKLTNEKTVQMKLVLYE